MKLFLRGAWVIARRDFSAVIFSRAFIMFLIFPMIPLLFGGVAAGLGAKAGGATRPPVIGLVMPAADAARVKAAHARLGSDFGIILPELRPEAGRSAEALMAAGGADITAVLSGSLAKPVLTLRKRDVSRIQNRVALVIAAARAEEALRPIELERHIVAENVQSRGDARLTTAQLTQIGLFLLTVMLAGMILSNMVEEKTNKIIEILAAAISIESIFVGKLAATLAMSLVGIACWSSIALGAALAFGREIPNLPAPALGWPMFVALTVAYFATAYSLLGALFISIGAQASSVREVQTLSMPVTMLQMLFFSLALYTVDAIGSKLELGAVLFPFSSPFAMVSRAAQSTLIWPHILALLWQILWIAIIIRLGTRLFRRNVLKSGRQRGLFSRRAGAPAQALG